MGTGTAIIKADKGMFENCGIGKLQLAPKVTADGGKGSEGTELREDMELYSEVCFFLPGEDLLYQ